MSLVKLATQYVRNAGQLYVECPVAQEAFNKPYTPFIRAFQKFNSILQTCFIHFRHECWGQKSALRSHACETHSLLWTYYRCSQHCQPRLVPCHLIADNRRLESSKDGEASFTTYKSLKNVLFRGISDNICFNGLKLTVEIHNLFYEKIKNLFRQDSARTFNKWYSLKQSQWVQNETWICRGTDRSKASFPGTEMFKALKMFKFRLGEHPSQKKCISVL